MKKIINAIKNDNLQKKIDLAKIKYNAINF